MACSSTVSIRAHACTCSHECGHGAGLSGTLWYSPPPTRRLALPHERLAAALLLALAPLAASAATIVVYVARQQQPAASSTCTLRQAIVSMNTGAGRELRRE
jgi:hypothetical protein